MAPKWKLPGITTPAPKKSKAGQYSGATPAKPVSSYNVGTKPGQKVGTNKPANMDAYRMVSAANPDIGWHDVRDWVDSGMGGAGQPGGPAPTSPFLGGSGSSGGGRRGGGGGGGGGGGAVSGQPQIDAMMRLLGSGAYTANPAIYDQMRKSIGDATAADKLASTNAYNSLDTYLQSNRTNPYADVKLTPAAGGADAGYGAFQNVLALLGAGQNAWNDSVGREAQMGRTFSGEQIGAADNAYLFNIANQQAQRQQTLDDEKRQALMQMMQLVGQGGATLPDLASIGIYAPGGTSTDPHGWTKIAADIAAGR